MDILRGEPDDTEDEDGEQLFTFELYSAVSIFGFHYSLALILKTS